MAKINLLTLTRAYKVGPKNISARDNIHSTGAAGLCVGPTEINRSQLSPFHPETLLKVGL